ncbi:hypothetical protein DSM25558_3207 [Agrobacterium sp. DSM 25558]|uniref:DNA-binding protein n=1 Tax=Agrobacterium sp. DSM 25558 TaxID=1907665 RepID=UPI00097247D6|nr:DNA-binding protein [Agrobacterium sp. DSM 25558]SCX22734.1 hypothetical protein DSM25558_3207 [Agrobacterium sp. DSM 25558]
MAYAEFISNLATAGLTVRAFAVLIGMNPNSISNYARTGECPTHLALIAALVANMHTHGLDFRAVISKVAVGSKKPRGGASVGQFGGDRQVPLDLKP